MTSRERNLWDWSAELEALLGAPCIVGENERSRFDVPGDEAAPGLGAGAE